MLAILVYNQGFTAQGALNKGGDHRRITPDILILAKGIEIAHYNNRVFIPLIQHAAVLFRRQLADSIKTARIHRMVFIHRRVKRVAVDLRGRSHDQQRFTLRGQQRSGEFKRTALIVLEVFFRVFHGLINRYIRRQMDNGVYAGGVNHLWSQRAVIKPEHQEFCLQSRVRQKGVPGQKLT